MLNSAFIKEFQDAVISYYNQEGRSFPWRETNDPYHILLSEFMLQQTQTERVQLKYEQWLSRFPTIESVADADFGIILEYWVGLGYNRRAKFLHETAKKIVNEHGGIISSDPSILQGFPGIGPYTSQAISTFAFNKPNVFIETNIRSVYIFFFFKEKKAVSDTEILSFIRESLYIKNPRMWYYALMDYGAKLKATIPNPNRKSKHYTKQSKFEGSIRQVRGAILRFLTESSIVTYETLLSSVNPDGSIVQKALEGLVAEGFICEKEQTYILKK